MEIQASYLQSSDCLPCKGNHVATRGTILRKNLLEDIFWLGDLW